MRSAKYNVSFIINLCLLWFLILIWYPGIAVWFLVMWILQEGCPRCLLNKLLVGHKVLIANTIGKSCDSRIENIFTVSHTITSIHISTDAFVQKNFHMLCTNFTDLCFFPLHTFQVDSFNECRPSFAFASTPLARMKWGTNHLYLAVCSGSVIQFPLD